MTSRVAWPALPALILLFVFFLFPVVRMLGFSLEGGTLEWYAKALGEGLYLQVMWNTFEIALLVTLFCLLLGYPLGFLIATTTPTWATLGFIFVLLPLWTSVLVRTYAWMVLLGRNGVFNRMLMDWGITSDPIPMLHNFTGVLIGMVHVLLPYMVLPIYGAVRRRRSGGGRRRGGAGRLELAHLLAHLHPAHAERHLRRLRAGVRAVAGLLHHAGAAGRRPGHHDRRADRAAGARGAELAVRLGPVGGPAGRDLCRLCACPARHAAGGADMRGKPLSRRLLIAAGALIYFFLMLPLLVVFPISLSSAPYLQFPPPGLSWQWYERYLDDPQWIDATWRSLYIGGATAVLALLLGVPLAFSLVRGRFFGRVLVDRLALAPIIVPTIILSVALYGVFAKLKLIGAWYGLVLAHTVLALPFVVLVMAAGLRDFDRSLEQAAAGLGASRWRTLSRVTLPLLRPSLVSAGLLAFISSFDEVVVALFLAGANMTLPKKMFDNILMEIDPTIASVSVIQILLVSIVMVLIGRFGRGLRDSAR